MKIVRARYLALLPLVAALSMALPALVPTGASDDSELIGSGPKPDLFLISTGDVVGYLRPCG